MSLLPEISVSTPEIFFFFGSLRDDAFGDYTIWDKNSVLEDLENGETAKLYGYTLHKGRWGNRAFICESKNKQNVVVGRILKFNGQGNFMNKLKAIRKKKQNGDNVMKIVNVYMADDEPNKSNAISVITFVNTRKIKTDLIESGNWLKQNVLKSETPRHSNNRIYSGKGASALRSHSSRVLFKEWKEDTIYEKDEIVCLDVSYKRWNKKVIDEFKFWAICMNEHKSNTLNMPQSDEIFTDLTLNHSAFVKLYLIEHVQGFNEELGTIIISYCYKTNDFWWNGCHSTKYDGYCNCGDLVMGLQSTKSCKLCVVKSKENDEASSSTESKKSGAVICLDKVDGNLVRTHLNNDKNDTNKDENTETDATHDIILRTKLESEAEKQKICNLFCRNFNPGMASLIKACVYGETSFVYKRNGKDIEVDIGKTAVWCMYDADDQLLCSLIWRFIHVDGPKETLMFEILFLSTFENVRFNHYGQKMVREIELYCIANQYDLMAVAAVPVHGEAFWKSNGFVLRHDAAKSNDEKANIRDKREDDYEMLKHHMLVFDDTPLFAKQVRIINKGKHKVPSLFNY